MQMNFSYILAAAYLGEPLTVTIPSSLLSLHTAYTNTYAEFLAKPERQTAKGWTEARDWHYIDFSNPATLKAVQEILSAPALVDAYRSQITTHRDTCGFPYKALWWHDRPGFTGIAVFGEQLYDTKCSLAVQVAARLEYLLALNADDFTVMVGACKCPTEKPKFRHFNLRNCNFNAPQFLSLGLPAPRQLV